MNEVSFRNSYLLMRHGESDANVSGVIVSDPKIGCEQFGLTDRGSKQIIASVKGFTGEAITQIVCSDFLRTLQTCLLYTSDAADEMDGGGVGGGGGLGAKRG